MMLDVTVRREGKSVYTDIALNDAALTKGAVARMVDLEVCADQMRIFSFSSDGVLVSTPTGSTASSCRPAAPSSNRRRKISLLLRSAPTRCPPGSFVLGKERTVSVKMGRAARKTTYLSVMAERRSKLNGGDVVELKMSASKTHLFG